MSTSHDGLGTANGQGEGQGARRELFNTVLRHGSEERMSTPSTSTSVEDSPAPRAQSTADPDHVNAVNTGFIQPATRECLDQSSYRRIEPPSDCETNATGASVTRQTLLAGEKALQIPTIPKGTP